MKFSTVFLFLFSFVGFCYINEKINKMSAQSSTSSTLITKDLNGFFGSGRSKSSIRVAAKPVQSSIDRLKADWEQNLASIKDVEARNYLNRFWLTAVREFDVNGYRPSLKMAQAIIESGFGTSTLCRKRNAHFGIKGYWKSRIPNSSMRRKDDHPNEKFHGYKTSWDSWRDHTLFMQQSRYRNVIKARDIESACYQLGVSGYATSQYRATLPRGRKGIPGSHVLEVVNQFNLELLDRIVGFQK